MMTIYTAIFGNYDELKEPRVITPGWEYVCFTDQDFKSDVWIVIKANGPGDRRLLARSAKISGILDGKSIWVDGSFIINCDLNKWWADHFISPMTVITHPFRQDVYEEGVRCIESNRGEGVKEQLEKYKQEGLPANGGLIQSGILMRESTAEVMNFCRMWQEQINLSWRDQIGFAYTEWKLGVRWPRITYDYRSGREFIFKTHIHRRK